MRISLLLFFFPLALAALPSCQSEAESPRASALRRSFPARAAEILGDAERPGPRAPLKKAIEAVLPRRGDEAVRLETPGGFAVAILEEGASGEASIEGAAVAFARPDHGIAFWREAAGGYEEWLLFQPGRADGAGPVASWEVAGGTLEQRGEAVEILDAAGTSRFRVTAPNAYTASGRAIGVRLGARGSRIELSLDGQTAGEAVLVDPAWIATSLMTTARWTHTATAMSDGRVLFVGGDPSTPAFGSAEIYDPATGLFAPAGTMPTPHSSHVAALLCDGRVLVAGGISSDDGYSHTAAIYDPVAGTWTAAKPSHYGHTYGTATALPAPDCRVLVTGGYDARNLSETYDPTTGAWTLIASTLSQTRFYHTATRLTDGRVVVAGGGYDDFNIWYTLPNVDAFDPVAGKWSTLFFLHAARRSHAAALLPDGSLLVSGGSNAGADDGVQAAVELDSVEIYPPSMGSWTKAPPLQQKRTAHTATLLDNGAVLVTGGVDDTGSALGTTAAFHDGAFFPAPSMNHDRYLHTASLLPDGAVLVAGGLYQATAEILRPDQRGMPCTDPSGCESGFCVDGLCCDTACTDACSRCDVPGAAGTCAPPCLDATHARACPGGGACADVATCVWTSCSPFLCTAAARGCSTTCATVADCAPGFACDHDHLCVAPPSSAEGDPGACGLQPSTPDRGPAALVVAALVAALAKRRRGARR